MGKTKFTALERVNSNDYKDDFYESNNKIKKHLIGASSRNITKQEINIALVKAFVEADIPLKKVNKLQTFFKEYCIEENMLNDPSKAVKELAKIFLNHENILIIELIIEFITLNAQ
ncbi:33835_t:CDS:2, partial [Racocetra persica]